MSIVTMRSTRRIAYAGSAAAMAVVLGATPAFAAPFTSEASARALKVSVVSGAVNINTGTEQATNDGTQPTVTDSQQPLISILNGQSIIKAGALVETAAARNDGTSAACAGVTGVGGVVDVGSQTNCVTNNGSGVQINLGTVPLLGTVSIRADAITAKCTGATDGTTMGTSTLANATLVINPFVGQNITVKLKANAAPNTNVLDLVSPAIAKLLAPVVNITLNEQSTQNGKITVTALSVDALSGRLADVQVAKVTCGPSADLAQVPVVPAKGLPVALGTLLMVGLGGAYVVRRRSTVRA